MGNGIESGRNEPLFPGIAVTGYELSQDGKRIVFSANGSGGTSQLWIATTDRTDPPSRIPNAEGDMPHFLRPGEVVFHAIENGATLVFRVRDDGTADEINEVQGTSPDGDFVIAWSRGETTAFPSPGGDPKPVMDEICSLRWQPDKKFLYLSIRIQSAGAFGRTYVIPLSSGTLLPPIPPHYVIPLSSGTLLPPIPPHGFHSEDQIARLPGVRVIDAADVFPGPTPATYAFSRQTVQRNLYRIPLLRACA